MPLLFLEKSEPNYFPFQVVKSDDGFGNLVAYDELNPTTGWTAPMASPFDGLWIRVEFSDYHVNFRHNGTTWVEYNKEAKSSGSITLYSSTEADTGLTDDEGDIIYCKTYNITNNVDTINVSGIGPVYETDIPKTSIKKRIGVDVFITQTLVNYTSSGYQFGQQFIFHNDYSNALIYVNNGASSTTKITIYYTKN